MFDVEKQSKELFYKCLRSISFVKSIDDVTKSYDFNIDSIFRIVFEKVKKPQYLIIETKTNGQPRYARQAVNQLLIIQKDMKEDNYGIFIAPFISSEAAQICKLNNMGYADFAGNCYISFSNVFIQKEGNPNPYTKEQDLKSLYNPKSERLLRVLLNSGPKEWKVADIARAADISFGLVSKVKKYLTDREWIVSETIGFKLVKPFELLDAWTEHYHYRKNDVKEYYSILSVSEVEEKLMAYSTISGDRTGLTGFSGGARIAPAVRYQRVMAYAENIEEFVDSLGLKQVNSGANVLILGPYDEGVFYGSRYVGSDLIVSPIQIYLDLMSISGRGEEAAEAIMEQVIKSIW